MWIKKKRICARTVKFGARIKKAKYENQYITLEKFNYKNLS